MTRLGTDRRRGPICLFLALVGLPSTLAPGSAATAPNPATESFSIGPYTRATGLTAGPANSLWFIGPTIAPEPPGSFVDVVGRVGLEGGKTEFALSDQVASGDGRIALGADGNLWFTDPAANAVGRLTPAGEMTEYPLPSPAADPGAIVAGPGAAMWFVEQATDKVGRVAPDGTIAEFPLAAGAQPTGIAAGADGALWIVEKGTAKIARMSATGAVTATYALPDPASRPHAIVLGPGNELWFSEEARSRVGRISVSGTIEEFPVPGENGTGELTLGSDGNLWFTTGYAIGSISASGATGEPECITSACNYPINALAKGPDGELWFATDIARGGGGGTALQSLYSGGLVGRFYAPLLGVRLGKRPTKVNDGLTTIAVSCHGGAAGEACRGQLRLTMVQRGRNVLLDQHRYRLEPATGRQLPLRLGARGKRALAGGKRLVVRISATQIGGGGAGKRFVLQARGRR